eukprot:CAMPEP_0179078916 /NCGR_PEP_ID=MMETSP0796-20121207/35376_1 /TAXON_ID=73915 /ORGANISM="Pyrodinium bahamense, Strain pbaha01" /LENGTH=527 /DNA_ID=CAMNT_0020776241 /DNA_START=94 /DNA_END=1677 /DNA_ORIENTATION=+
MKWARVRAAGRRARTPYKSPVDEAALLSDTQTQAPSVSPRTMMCSSEDFRDEPEQSWDPGTATEVSMSDAEKQEVEAPTEQSQQALHSQLRRVCWRESQEEGMGQAGLCCAWSRRTCCSSAAAVVGVLLAFAGLAAATGWIPALGAEGPDFSTAKVTQELTPDRLRMDRHEQRKHAEEDFFEAEHRRQHARDAALVRQRAAELHNQEREKQQFLGRLKQEPEGSASSDWLPQEEEAEVGSHGGRGQAGLLQAKNTTTTITASMTTSTVTSTVSALYRGYQSLYCFSITMATEPEKSLLAAQLAMGQGIFECDIYALFSDVKAKLDSGPHAPVQTTVISTEPDASSGTRSSEWTAITSIHAWERVIADGAYQDCMWVVKADLDCVFFPSRLRWHLKTLWEDQLKMYSTAGVYLRNCARKDGRGFFGAIEVLSRQAAKVFSSGWSHCQGALHLERRGDGLFLQKCLDLLKVSHEYDFGMVVDEHCGGVPRPCTAGSAAFHPVSTSHGYRQCVKQAAGGPGSEGLEVGLE